MLQILKRTLQPFNSLKNVEKKSYDLSQINLGCNPFEEISEGQTNLCFEILKEKNSIPNEFVGNELLRISNIIENKLTKVSLFDERMMVERKTLRDIFVDGGLGYCYYLSLFYCLNDSSYTLVHGTWKNKNGIVYQHAWLEKSNFVFDPAFRIFRNKYTCYKDKNAVIHKKYNSNRAKLNLIKYQGIRNWNNNKSKIKFSQKFVFDINKYYRNNDNIELFDYSINKTGSWVGNVILGSEKEKIKNYECYENLHVLI